MTLQAEYKKRNPFGHFFDEDTMRFFKSEIGLIREKGGVWFFATSEKPLYGRRQWTVREMTIDGTMNTIGDFCSLTKAKAESMVKELAGAKTTK